MSKWGKPCSETSTSTSTTKLSRPTFAPEKTLANIRQLYQNILNHSILYATTNPGKIFEVKRLLTAYNINVVSPKDLGLDIDVEETGSSLTENSVLKAKAYLDGVKNYVVMADDTGLEIEALNGEPGIHARRWRDGKTRMTDQEVIDYCLYKMKDVPKGKRHARFRTVITLAFGEVFETFDGILEGEILQKPIPLRIEGVPFESLFYIPKWKLVLGEVHQMPVEKGKNS